MGKKAAFCNGFIDNYRAEQGRYENFRYKKEKYERKGFLERVERLSKHPGLHKGNVHKQQCANAALGLFSGWSNSMQGIVDHNLILGSVRNHSPGTLAAMPRSSAKFSFPSPDTETRECQTVRPAASNSSSASQLPARMLFLNTLLSVGTPVEQEHTGISETEYYRARPLPPECKAELPQDPVITKEFSNSILTETTDQIPSEIYSEQSTGVSKISITSSSDENILTTIQQEPKSIDQARDKGQSQLYGTSAASNVASPELLPLFVASANLASIPYQQTKLPSNLKYAPLASLIGIFGSGAIYSYFRSKQPRVEEGGSTSLQNPADDSQILHRESELVAPPVAMALVDSRDGSDRQYKTNVLMEERFSDINFSDVTALRNDLINYGTKLEFKGNDYVYYQYALDSAFLSKEVKFADLNDKRVYYLLKIMQIISYMDKIETEGKDSVWKIILAKLSNKIDSIRVTKNQRKIEDFIKIYLQKTPEEIRNPNKEFTSGIVFHGEAIYFDKIYLGDSKIEYREATYEINEMLNEIGLLRHDSTTISTINSLVYFLHHPNEMDYLYTEDEVIDMVYNKIKDIIVKYQDLDYPKYRIKEDFKLRVIDDYIFNIVMEKSFNLWIQSNTKDLMTATGNVTANQLRNKLVGLIENCSFSQEVKKYLYQKFLFNDFPYFAHFPNPEEQAVAKPHSATGFNLAPKVYGDISSLHINSPLFALTHVGIMFNINHNINSESYSRKDLERLGKELYVLLNKNENDYQSLNKYFLYPAIISEANTLTTQLDWDKEMVFMQNFIIEYYKKVGREILNQDEYYQFYLAQKNWKTRPQLARHIFKKARVNPQDFHIASYLYHNKGMKGGIPNIGEEYNKQNENLAKKFHKFYVRWINEMLGEEIPEIRTLREQSRIYELESTATRSILAKVNIPELLNIKTTARFYLCLNDNSGPQLLRVVERPYKQVLYLPNKNAAEERLSVDADVNNLTKSKPFNSDYDSDFRLFSLDEKYINESQTAAAEAVEINLLDYISTKQTSIEDIIQNLALEKSNTLKDEISKFGFGPDTSTMFLKNVILSLLPLYEAGKAFKEGDYLYGGINVLIDITAFLKVANVGRKLVNKVFYQSSWLMLNALQAGKLSSGVLRKISAQMKYVVANAYQLNKVIGKKELSRLMIELVKGFDPGFEWFYDIGMFGRSASMGTNIGARLQPSNLQYKSSEFARVDSAIANKAVFDPKLSVIANSYTAKERSSGLYQVYTNANTNKKSKVIIEEEIDKIAVYRDFDDYGLLNKQYTLNQNNQLTEVIVASDSVTYPSRSKKSNGLNSEGEASGSKNILSAFDSAIDIKQVIAVDNFAGQVVQTKLAGSRYIHYSAHAEGEGNVANALVVSAHGGYITSDLDPMNRPLVQLPPGVTVELLAPHNYALMDPGLEVVASGNYRPYATFKAEVQQPDVHFNKDVPENSKDISEDFDPTDLLNVQGHLDGLINYRHWAFLTESPSEIADVLVRNRQLSAPGGRTADILVVGDDIYDVTKAFEEQVETSIQDVLNLVKEGRVLNSQGQKYDRVIFSHCRNHIFEDKDLVYHVVSPESDIAKGSTKAIQTEVIVTELHRIADSSVFRKSTLIKSKIAIVAAKTINASTELPSKASVASEVSGR